MTDAPLLDWKNDPHLRQKRKELADLYSAHARASDAKDTAECGRLMTQINALLDELQIRLPRQIGL